MIWKIEFDFIPEITIEPILEGGGGGLEGQDNQRDRKKMGGMPF